MKDVSGQTFGRLTAIGAVAPRERRVKWFCICDCGSETVVMLRSLMSGNTVSCGCLKTERLASRNKTHGMSRTPEYRAYAHMVGRCTNPTDNHYQSYGGRGIEMKYKSFEDFYDDVGLRTTPQHSIDRIDNDGNYERGNCKWSTSKEQHRNTSRTRMITFKGATRSMVEWSEVTGIEYEKLKWRLNTQPVARALRHDSSTHIDPT